MILKLKKAVLVVIGYLLVACGGGSDRGELVGAKTLWNGFGSGRCFRNGKF